jgi:hypothetical protein
MSFEDELHSLERGERLTAERYDASNEAARDELAGLPKYWPGSMGPPEREIQRCKDAIGASERGAQVSRRRADHASAGYMLLTEDEHCDQEYMQKYSGLISEAHKRGRAKGSDGSVPFPGFVR